MRESEIFNVTNARIHSEEKAICRSIGKQSMKKSKIFNATNAQNHSRGLDPERKIGATDSSDELTFLIKWEGSDKEDLAPSREAVFDQMERQ